MIWTFAENMYFYLISILNAGILFVLEYFYVIVLVLFFKWMICCLLSVTLYVFHLCPFLYSYLVTQSNIAFILRVRM